MKINRSTLIPLILVIYLAIMAGIGYPSYASGQTSATYYFGVIGATVLIIILLHFNLRHRERLRRERLEDIDRTDSKDDNSNQ